MSTKRSEGNKNSNARNSRPSGSPSPTRKKRRRSRNKPDPRKFWGNSDMLPKPIHGLSAPPMTNVIPLSLGKPPIAGQETASIQFIDSIYNRSVGLALALATAGGLDLPAPEGDHEVAAEDHHNAADSVVDSFNALQQSEDSSEGNRI
ncbi:MAG: hypothetical protein P8J01_07035 [Acidimicrobiales bacterium]|nr:hypothetical protein [Acidimicrobiales bacterium]MDG1846138.1 hypothetical protein [Acidimicrobiales bacterium]|tara:strand:+ start:500 stop:943 length:444 start_codon:yes stop_codon:yes gene_type:complete